MRVIVLGAGVVGVTTAYQLHQAGHEVTVIDRQPQSARECSYANGGQLSYSHGQPWASPAALRKLPSWLLDRHGPVIFHLSKDLLMWRFLWRFLGHCRTSKMQETTEQLLRLGMYSKQMLHECDVHQNLSYHHTAEGTLHLFSDNASFESACAHSEFQQTLGCPYERMDSFAACIEKEPALAASPAKIRGGVFYPMDEAGDVHIFTHALTDYLIEKGVNFLFGNNIRKIYTEGDSITGVLSGQETHRADAYVMCLGAYSPLLCRTIGIDLPIYPMKGYSLSISVADHENAPTRPLTDQANKIVYSRLGNILRVAGTAEFSGYDHTIGQERISSIATMVRRLFPNLEGIDSATPWSCLRPSTPKGTPIIGQKAYRNFYLNTGHGTLGWTLAHGSAKLISDIISGKTPDIDPAGLVL